jgi:beta-phosphoglucomutase family hydrolase
MLGLPDGIRACLFDLDGVLTRTATIHAAAWKQMFDAFLASPAATAAGGKGDDLRPFDDRDDYDEYVDGKPRLDGVRDFLASRHIHLPEGGSDDPATADSVNGLGNRKNELVLQLINDRGVETFPGSVQFVRAVRQAGLRTAVVSSSANTKQVLEVTKIADLFEERVDGVVAAHEQLKGKPAPDTFLAAARRLGVPPSEAAVFEDALAGVAAGQAGGFGFVVGVDRVGQAQALAAHGADRVVSDLSELMEEALP